MEYFSGNAQLRMSAGSFENTSFPGNHSAGASVPNQSQYSHPSEHIDAQASSNTPAQPGGLQDDVDPMMMLTGSQENSAPIYFDFNPNPVSSATQREIDSYLGLEVGSSNSRHNSLLFEPAGKSIDEMDVSPAQFMASPPILSNDPASVASPSVSASTSILSRNVMQRRVGNQSSAVMESSSSAIAPNANVMRLYEIDMPTSQEAGSFPKAGSYKEYQGLLDSELDLHLDGCS